MKDVVSVRDLYDCNKYYKTSDEHLINVLRCNYQQLLMVRVDTTNLEEVNFEDNWYVVDRYYLEEGEIHEGMPVYGIHFEDKARVVIREQDIETVVVEVIHKRTNPLPEIHEKLNTLLEFYLGLGLSPTELLDTVTTVLEDNPLLGGVRK